METVQVLGVLVAAAAGLCMGSSAWSVKTLRRFQFEQWWFLGMLVGLVILPWTVTLMAFPNVFAAYRDVAPSALITSNLFSIAWGVANVLCGMCFIRIGVALTGAILTGLGASVAVTLPMICKGTGLFKQAPDIGSPAGITVLAGVGIMIVGVLLASLAGFGRDRELKKLQATSGSFSGGLIMTIIAGICSAGMSLAFVYSQGPIVARVSMVEAGQTLGLVVAQNKTLTGNYHVSAGGTIVLKGLGLVEVAGMSAKAAADRIAGKLGLSQQPEADAKVSVEANNILAVFPVNAIALLGGALINLCYPAYLMTKKGTWGILFGGGREIVFTVLGGLQFCLAVILNGKGMLLLGALGASVGAGIQQSMQMVGGQGLGFLSGEWRGVNGKPRWQMYGAIALLLVAMVVMAYANTLMN
jgi:hypothetical protein